MSCAFPALPSVIAPDALALLRALAPSIDNGMLEEMAASDRGQKRALHLAHLRVLRTAGTSPVPIGAEPRRVLELTRALEPDAVPEGQETARLRGHRMRLFACACLLKIGQETANIGTLDSQIETLVQFGESARALDASLARPAAALLVWCLCQLQRRQDQYCGDMAFMALVLLELRLPCEVRERAALAALCDWITSCADCAARKAEQGLTASRWLAATAAASAGHHKWEQMGVGFSARASKEPSPELKGWLASIGLVLSGLPHADRQRRMGRAPS